MTHTCEIFSNFFQSLFQLNIQLFWVGNNFEQRGCVMNARSISRTSRRILMKFARHIQMNDTYFWNFFQIFLNLISYITSNFFDNTAVLLNGPGLSNVLNDFSWRCTLCLQIICIGPFYFSHFSSSILFFPSFLSSPVCLTLAINPEANRDLFAASHFPRWLRLSRSHRIPLRRPTES